MTAPTRILSFGGDVRCAGEWRFEGGGFVQILIGGNVDTETALRYVDTLIDLKRDELAQRARGEIKASEEIVADIPSKDIKGASK